MRVLITGGAGFIGHSVAIHLKSRSYDVAVLDNLRRASGYAIERLKECRIPLAKGDVLSAEMLRRVLASVDVVVHAAAYISVEESVQRPALYIKNNVAGTASVAAACLQQGVKLLVYISSAAVYGNPVALPIDEFHPTNPISPYGLSKLMGEEVVRFYAQQGLRYVILRLFNVYGPGQSSPYAGVVTHFIKRVCRGEPPIVYGDGRQTRDFIHVSDVAEAVRLTIERGIENEVLNIGTGRPTSIRELAELVIKLANPSLKPIFTRPRPGDIEDSYADISKAKRLLGFEPRVSLEQGLRELLKLEAGEPPDRE